MSEKPALVVLAAGMGSRYGGLKQIDPVGMNGEIILDYSIFDAIRGGFGKVVFVIRHDIEKDFRECVGKRWENRVAVEYAFQDLKDLPAPYTLPEGRVKPWGTGHALLAAQKFLKESFAVVNADDFYGADAYAKLGKEFLGSPANGGKKQYYMVGFELGKTLSEFGSVARGICKADENEMLSDIVEHTGIVSDGKGGAVCEDGSRFPGETIASMNFWGFTPGIFEDLEPLFREFLASRGGEMKSEFYIPSSVFAMIRSGKARVKVLHSSDSWFGVTYRDDKPFVQKSIRELTAAGRYPEKI